MMQSSFEVETKLEIDALAFRQLQAIGTVRSRKLQLNVYYDAGWMLADRAMTFRVRYACGARPVVTLKVPVKRDGGRRTSEETEVNADALWPNCHVPPREISVRGLPVAFWSRLPSVETLRRVGWVRNLRQVVDVGCGAIELDCLWLPGGLTFFEVEVEEADPARHRALVERVGEVAPHAAASTLSKFERFRAAAERVGSARAPKDTGGHQ